MKNKRKKIILGEEKEVEREGEEYRRNEKKEKNGK